MIRQIHGAEPTSSLPDDGDGDPGGGSTHQVTTRIDPAAALDAIEADDAPVSPPSFALLATLQHRNLRTWPRQRRRDSKRPHQTPPPLPLASPSSSSHSLTSFAPDSVAPPPPPLPPFPSSRTAFSQHQSREPKQPKHPQHRRQRPYPLNDCTQGRSPSLSDSPPQLPSPPPSTPSVTETPRDVEQLASDLSRQHLERTCFHGGSGTSIGGCGSGDGNRSGPVNFSFGMAEFRLRRGGNEPVTDLEVDMGQDSRNDDGDCIMRPPTPSPYIPSHSQPGPPSSYAASTDVDAGPSVPPSLQRMRQRQAALAAVSVRHLDLDLAPFARQISPETDAHLAPGEAVTPMTTTTTTDMIGTVTAATPPTTVATATTIASTTGAAAEAAAASIEVGDTQLPLPPPESMAMVAPYPQRPFHFHPHSYSRPYHSQSQSLAHSLPYSHSYSRQSSASVTAASTFSAQPSPYFRLSPESLAMSHLAPQHSDVPSSGYDLQGWISSSSTVEPTAALTTGPIDGEAVSVDAGAVDTDSYAPTAAPTPRIVETLVENMIPNDDQCNVSMPTKMLPIPPASVRRQQRKQFYTSYLPPQSLPLHHDTFRPFELMRGPNPPVDDLEADMEEPNANNSADPAVAGPTSASASATTSTPAVSYATQEGSTSTTTRNRQYMFVSQRVKWIQMAVALEAERSRSEQSAGGSAAGSAVIPDDVMDVEMKDPTAIEPDSPPSLSTTIDESLPPQQDASQPNGVHNYMGPLRFRLSSEVAMRCANLVHCKPRMRRRPPSESSENNDGVSSVKQSGTKESSIKEGSVKEGSIRADARDKGMHGERNRERNRDRGRADRADRDREREQHRGVRERRIRVSRHREHREQTRQTQVQPQSQPQPEATAPFQDPAQTQAQQHRHTEQLTEQRPLPALVPLEPKPIDAIAIDTS